jgi:tRNA pseudouridine55 synthase
MTTTPPQQGRVTARDAALVAHAGTGADRSGIVVVDKSPAMTSHDVVARMRRIAGTRRVGHAGTLDPMATGVLVIGVGKATRLLGYLALTEKDYLATIRLGQATVTDDAEGEVVPHPGGLEPSVVASTLSEDSLRTALAKLTGQIEQVPPKISAIKINGKRAYHLTRSGAAPDLAARPVTVSRLDLLAVGPAAGTPDMLDIDVAVTCSSGTYVRAIARDLGAALGTGGHLTALRRTRVGPYQVSAARTLDQLADVFEMIPLAQAAQAAFPAMHLDATAARLIAHGAKVQLTGGPGDQGTPIAAFAPDGTLVALIAEEDGGMQPLAVFVP